MHDTSIADIRLCEEEQNFDNDTLYQEADEHSKRHLKFKVTNLIKYATTQAAAPKQVSIPMLQVEESLIQLDNDVVGQMKKYLDTQRQKGRSFFKSKDPNNRFRIPYYHKIARMPYQQALPAKNVTRKSYDMNDRNYLEQPVDKSG